MSDDVGQDADRWSWRRGRMDIARGAIGPRRGQGSVGVSQSSVHDYTPKDYKRLRGTVANDLLDRARTGGPAIEGPFVAPITGDETQALNQYRQNEFDPGGVGAAADTQLKATLGDPNANPFLKAMIDAAIRPITQNAQIKELQDRAQFTGTGQKIQGSTAFQENRNNAIRDTQSQVADVATRLAFEERKNQLEAVSLATTRLQEQREGIAALALPRLIAQFGIDAGNKELQRRFQIMEQAIQTMAQVSQPTLASKSTSFSTGGGFLGGGASQTTAPADTNEAPTIKA